MLRVLVPLAFVLACASTAPARAQSGTGSFWTDFGPDRGNGAFLNITRRHRVSHNAQGIAVDPKQRILVLNEWVENASGTIDCAVSRHIRNARLLDMDFTGPEELEATRRIQFDIGGPQNDICTGIDVDNLSRPVVVGWTPSPTGATGFVVRLTENGDYDTAFSSDGKLALNNLTPFLDLPSRINDVEVQPNGRILLCGYVDRAGERNMIVARLTGAGILDTSFSGNGYSEYDFNGGGDDSDSCSRVLVLPDGDIVAGGIANHSGGDVGYGLVRMHSDGSADTGFSGDGRVVIDDGSQLVAIPSLADLGYDAGRNRLLVGCTLYITPLDSSSGCVIAVDDDGTLDTTFNGDGRQTFRYSNFGSGSPREAGDTRLRRLLVRDDGSFYLLGTHYNSTADATTFGASDVATLRMEPNGSVTTSGSNVYSGDGVEFYAFPTVRQKDISEATNNRVPEALVDATWYRGNLLLLADRPRYPGNIFDHDNDGNLAELGPYAPLVASVRADRLFNDDFEFDGMNVPQGGLMPIISPPAGYGNYCSVTSPTQPSVYGVLPQGTGSDPCQQYLDGNPALVIQRSGLYSLSGLNWVVGTCDGGFITLRGGNGTTPIDQAFGDTSGRTNCIFTVTPHELRVFSRPYTGAHLATTAQAFNHDPYGIPLDVSEFGQTPGTYDACLIDNRGRQRSIGNPAIEDACVGDGSGVDEPAVDILVTSSRNVVSVASGRVSMAVPRFVAMFTPPQFDPYQREVFIRHTIGSGRYSEVFSTYYAHMQDTAVRHGQFVSAGTVIGQVGTTGSSGGEHLHLGVMRHKNLTWRQTFDLDYAGGSWDRNARVGAFDAWGWLAPQGADPWAWRFRGAGTGSNDNAGTFSSILWISGEEPTIF